MLRKMRDNFFNGIAKLKWFANVFAERLQIEISIVRLLHRTDGIMKKRADLIRTIGERVYELRDRTEKNILSDKTILEAVRAVADMEEEVKSLNEKVSDLSQVRDR